MKKYLSVSMVIAAVLLFGFSMNNIALAQGTAPFTDIGTGINPITVDDQMDTQDVTTALENIANVMKNVLLLLAVIFVLIAAYNYLFSGGSDEKVNTAHKMLTYAAVAVLVALLAFGFESIIRDVLGFGRG